MPRTLATAVSVRDSLARPDAGAVTPRHEMRCATSAASIVATCEHAVLVRRRPPNPGEVWVA